MHKVTYGELERNFDEINRVLFFSQVVWPDMTILTSAHDFINSLICSDGSTSLTISQNFAREQHYMYVLVHEMIALYEYQVTGEKCKYSTFFSIYSNHAWKKFGDRIEDPLEVA